MIRLSCIDDAVQRKSLDSDVAKGSVPGPPSPPAANNAFKVSGQFGQICSRLRALKDLLEYERAKSQFGDTVEEFDRLFRRFLAGGTGGRCLRLLFDADSEDELGPNWATLDLAPIETRAKEGGQISIDLEDEYFDSVLLTGLSQISRPQFLIAEVRRVLKRTGQIWVQVPLNIPYFLSQNPNQREYWRITPEGLRVLFEGFDEIFCSVYLPGGNALRKFSFFYGLKPPIETDD